MKTSLPLRLAILMVIAFAGFIFSCKKDSAVNNYNSTSTDVQTQADDQAMVSNENENLSNDVNTVLISKVATNGNAHQLSMQSGTTAVNGRTAVNGTGSANDVLICDATVVFDTVSDPRKITINYNGGICWGNRTRTGTVIVFLAANTHWRDVGATVTVLVQDLKITRQRDNKTITINGQKIITNQSGGSLKDLSSLGSIVYTVSDSVMVLFSDSTTKAWRAEKKRAFTFDNGMVITTTGNHADNFHTGIAEWGTNRFGINFTTLITQAIVIRQDCDFRLVSGEAEILRSDDIVSDIIFGLDVNGNATGCPGTGNYYLQVAWTAPNGKTYPIILPY